MAELLSIQAIIMSDIPQQFSMCALLRDFAVFDDDNPVRPPNSGEAMRNHERGASLHQGFHATLDKRFRQCIYAGGRFVHDEQFRSSQDSSCKADQLFLSNRKQVT